MPISPGRGGACKPAVATGGGCLGSWTGNLLYTSTRAQADFERPGAGRRPTRPALPPPPP